MPHVHQQLKRPAPVALPAKHIWQNAAPNQTAACHKQHHITVVLALRHHGHALESSVETLWTACATDLTDIQMGGVVNQYGDSAVQPARHG